MSVSWFLGFLWALCKARGERGDCPFSVDVSVAAEWRTETPTSRNSKQQPQDHTECNTALKAGLTGGCESNNQPAQLLMIDWIFCPPTSIKTPQASRECLACRNRNIITQHICYKHRYSQLNIDESVWTCAAAHTSVFSYVWEGSEQW